MEQIRRQQALQTAKPQLSPAENLRRLKAAEPGHASVGLPSALITVHVFQDLKCSMCKVAARDVLPAMDKEFIQTGKVRLVYLDFPMGEQERQLAQAARCLNEGREYERFIQSALNQIKIPANEIIHAFVAQDPEAFKRCVDSHGNEEAVRADLILATALGVDGTPSFFINGQPLIGAQPYERFRQAILQAKPVMVSKRSRRAK